MSAIRTAGAILGCAILFGTGSARSQDWPQWRGANRDARATGFKAPQTWPKEPTKKWKVTLGAGVSTPALVGDKLYVFTQQGGSEIARCLNAEDGKEIWQDKYDSSAVSGIAAGRAGEFGGPRSSPAVADGKVVTLGAKGILSCLDAASGKKLWRKEDYKGSVPMFSTSSSPIIADGLCVAQLGGQRDGVLVAYELATGNEKWKWKGDSPAYASLALLSTGGMKVVIAETQSKIVGVNLADGKLLWETPYSPRAGGGGGRAYNASTPMAEGEQLIYAGSGRGTKAVKFEKKGEALEAKELWSNPDNSVQFNTPVVKDGLLYALSAQDTLYCINAKTGKTAWTSPLGGGGGRGNAGYGSIVDAGPVLMALTPRTELIVFEPGEKEFKQLAKYKVGDSETYAYPIVSGNRVFVKDKDSVTLWTIE